MRVKKTNLLALMVLFLQFFLIVVLNMQNGYLDYRLMSVIAIVCTIFDIVLLKVMCKFPILSIPNFFGFFSLIFHCGQLIKDGFNIDGFVPLPFENYGGADTIQASFIFFILSQTVYYIGVLLFQRKKRVAKKWKKFEVVNNLVYAKFLIIIGILPRFYIDVFSLIGAMSGGYEGVYSIYFPQVIQTLAFFFDAGLIFLLYGCKTKKTQKICFLLVVIYKCVLMTTGARQDKVCFLLIWAYVYFIILNKLTIGNLFVLSGICIAGFVFISAIGIVRVASSTSLGQIFTLMQSGTMTNILGGALGEFGSAFDTLELAIKYTPSQIDYGYGRSYLSGMLSVVPLLVNKIPVLSGTVIFLNQLPRTITFALGGSFLAEFYYNFSWLGLLGSLAVGAFLSKLHYGIISKDENKSTQYRSWCSILAIAMMLFIRGYFTDMVQKLVWTYLAIYLIQMYFNKKKKERLDSNA